MARLRFAVPEMFARADGSATRWMTSTVLSLLLPAPKNGLTVACWLHLLRRGGLGLGGSVETRAPPLANGGETAAVHERSAQSHRLVDEVGSRLALVSGAK